MYNVLKYPATFSNIFIAILYSGYCTGYCLLHFVQWLMYWLLPVTFCTVVTVLATACYILYSGYCIGYCLLHFYSGYCIGYCLLHFVQWLLYWLLPVTFCTVVTVLATACYILYSGYCISYCLLHFVQWLLYWLLPVSFAWHQLWTMCQALHNSWNVLSFPQQISDNEDKISADKNTSRIDNTWIYIYIYTHTHTHTTYFWNRRQYLSYLF